MAQFREGVATILMATSVVARGLDIPDVERVINFDMPTEIGMFVACRNFFSILFVSYVQFRYRVGRLG